MSTTIVDAPGIRPSDWAWAQRAIAEIQADAHLQHLADKWQAAANALSQAEALSTQPSPERGEAMEQLLTMGHALQQLGQPVRTLHLEILWQHDYAPPTTSPERIAEIQDLIFGTPHAA
jgi:hypothetical protein